MAANKSSSKQDDTKISVLFDGEKFTVNQNTTADLEVMGVTEEFIPDMLGIMRARALAYGYELDIVYKEQEQVQ